MPCHLLTASGARACASALLCVFVSLGGCAHTPPTAHRLGVPRAGAAERRPAPISPSPREQALFRSEVLDAASLVRTVLARNPGIDAARQGFRAALGRERASGAIDDPMLELRLAPLSLASPRAPVGYELMISQRLSWFGKRALETAAATADSAAAQSDLEAARRELAFAALGLYYRYFVAHRMLEVNAEHVELMRALREAVKVQVASSRGSAEELLQAETKLSRLERERLGLSSEREVLVAQLNELMHRDPSLPLPPPPRDLGIAPRPDAGAAGLTMTAVEQRPDVTAARHRARAARARTERAEREKYPDFTLSSSYSSMWEMPEHRFTVGLGFELPIFTARREGGLEEARASQAQLQSEVVKISDAARSQIFVALRRQREAAEVLGLVEARLLPLARARLEAAKARLSVAESSVAGAIEAEKSLRSEELEYQTARAEYAMRRAELAWALGKMPGLDGEEVEP